VAIRLIQAPKLRDESNRARERYALQNASTRTVFTIQLWYAVPILPIGMGIYYLAWKFLVGFLNEEIGIA